MNQTQSRVGRPRFTGTTTYTDDQQRFEFRYPSDWIISTLEDDREGVIVQPEEDEPATYFAVWVNPLEIGVVADDLSDLRAGFDAGLDNLADLQVLESRDDTYNNIVKLERTYTFTEDGATRKRRLWAMYADQLQFVVVYQGSSVDEYAYWLPMGNYCFTAFQLPMSLWFATDPSIATRPGTEPAGPDAIDGSKAGD
ncbi:hypothetical protein [Microlunatus elymi]|uniref:hypothetical protein n=1 Tax=Microlunatus elymi TaxID=2596828 RepID=UPI001AF002FC|nr:hypothetical protein [Microlunatus elymi]